MHKDVLKNYMTSLCNLQGQGQTKHSRPYPPSLEETRKGLQARLINKEKNPKGKDAPPDDNMKQAQDGQEKIKELDEVKNEDKERGYPLFIPLSADKITRARGARVNATSQSQIMGSASKVGLSRSLITYNARLKNILN